MTGMTREPPLFIYNSQHDRAAAEYLNDLFKMAAVKKIPDIHFQWIQGLLHIRLRVGSSMQAHEILDTVTAKLIDTKIRSRANMDLSQFQSPMDGRISLRYSDDISIDVRVNVVPSHGGQKIVCRLLDQANASLTLDDIGMPALADDAFRNMLKEEQGLILVTGPTGSGKTTTLYAALNEINDGSLNINTIEQPVEYVVPGFVQLNVTPYLSFASGLRALLRQDPDVILIGEIRDQETAEIAIQAANTGHLVLATLHANNGAQAIPRLLDLGVDRQTLASVLIGVIAQRLVDTLNKDMTHESSGITDYERYWLKQNGLPNITGEILRAESKQAFVGKRPIIELIKSDKYVKRAILAGEGEMGVLNAAARQLQFDTLGQAAIRMVSNRETTMDKVQRLIKDDSVTPRVRRLGDVLISKGLITFGQANDAAEYQLQERKKGKVVKLGQILISNLLVSQEQVSEAIGYTEGAVEFLNELAASRKISYKLLQGVVELWRTERHQESLFDLVIEQDLITKGKLYEEVFNSDGYGYTPAESSSVDGTRAAALASV